MDHDMKALNEIIEKHLEAGLKWSQFTVVLVALEYAEHMGNQRADQLREKGGLTA